MRNVAIAAATAIALVVGTGAAKAQQNFEWVAGSLGGGWYTMAAGLANIVQEKNPNIRIRVVPGGGRDNPTRLENNISQFGFGLDFLTQSAIKGEAPYRAKHTKVMHMGVGWSPTHFQLVGHNEGPADMRAILNQRGLRIGTPPRSSSDTLVLDYALQFFGTSTDKVRQNGGRVVNGSYTDLANYYIDGQVDYVWVALALPAAMVNEIQQGRRAARLIDFPADLRSAMSQQHGLSQAPVPAGAYPKLQNGPVNATTMDTVLLVNNTVPDAVVAAVLKTLLENRSRFGSIHQSMTAFNPAEAWKYPGAPLHPAADRVYREMGFRR